MTPKEALLKDGQVPVTAGRGRMSAAAVARVKELVAEGWDIKGYSKVSTADAPTKVVKAAKVGHKEIADLPPLRYDEKEWKAVSDIPSEIGQTVFGMREVCEFCGTSLNYHTCDTPRTHGVPVRIVQK